MHIVLLLLIALTVAYSVEGVICPSGPGWKPFTDPFTKITSCYKFIPDYKLCHGLNVPPHVH